MISNDIAGKQHWDGIYEGIAPTPSGWHWRPEYYHEQVMVRALLEEIERAKAKSILEVGCGNSIWLPHLARETGATAAGLDYSQQGCELTRRHLRAEGLDGNVWCGDLFKASPEDVGQYDFVYSLGLVEHFSDLENVLGALLKFVRPGGTLFTLVPNLRSVHGLAMWVWQPELLRKHELISKGQLTRTYKNLGLTDVRAQCLGVFSLFLVPWSIYPRWPSLVPKTLSLINWINLRLDHRLRRLGWFKGVSPLAPYLIAAGRKRE